MSNEPITGSGAFFTNPDILKLLPPPCADVEKTGGKLVGIISNLRHILAWNYSEGLGVRVVADRDHADEQEWTVFVWSSGLIRFQGTVLGGRGMAVRFVRFLRNGMTSRTKKCRKNHENHKRNREARAAEVSTEKEVN